MSPPLRPTWSRVVVLLLLEARLVIRKSSFPFHLAESTEKKSKAYSTLAIRGSCSTAMKAKREGREDTTKLHQTWQRKLTCQRTIVETFTNVIIIKRVMMGICTKLGKQVDMFKNNCNDSSSTSSLSEVSEDRNLQDCTKPYYYITLPISLLPPFDPLRILLPSIHRNSLGVGCSARVLLHRPHLSPED